MNNKEYVEKAVSVVLAGKSEQDRRATSVKIVRKLEGINIESEYKRITNGVSNLPARQRVLVKDVYEYATKASDCVEAGECTEASEVAE